LRTIADDLNKHIRNTDILSRWGGEEFLLICHGLKQEDIAPFTDKLLRVVRDASPGCGLHAANEMITISIGVSAFIAEDGIAQDAVKRADKALYQAKALGKNRAVLLLSGEDTQAG
jgi:diguanylate cyclase (GGDEF)-like protein